MYSFICFYFPARPKVLYSSYTAAFWQRQIRSHFVLILLRYWSIYLFICSTVATMMYEDNGKQLVSDLTDSQREVLLLHFNSLAEGYFSFFILVIAAFCHSERSNCHYWAPFSRATESRGFLSVNRTPLRIPNALGKGYELIASGTCNENKGCGMSEKPHFVIHLQRTMLEGGKKNTIIGAGFEVVTDDGKIPLRN